MGVSKTSSSSRWLELVFPPRETRLEAVGVKFTPGGAHISRTMMLREIGLLLRALPPHSSAAAYSDAVVVGNVLGKGTESTRKKSLRHLRELYGLTTELPIFRAFREFRARDAAAEPLLALLCAWTRDPLLRATTPPVFHAMPGESVNSVALAEAVADAFPDRYSLPNQRKIGRNAAATWTQSGHLHGHTNKVRARVDARPAAVAFALWIGSVASFAGEALLASPWCRLLDLNAEQARSRAGEAHRHGLLNLRAAGSVVEITFPQIEAIVPFPK